MEAYLESDSPLHPVLGAAKLDVELSENMNLEEDNLGNFREHLKLISNFDVLLNEHLDRSQTKVGPLSYLSARMQNELIKLMAKEVRHHVLKEIRSARYCGILLDSTPDISDREQLSIVSRYVHIDYQTKEVTVKESFVDFVVEDGKNAESLSVLVLRQLEKYGLDFTNCRSRCYDNSGVMSGHRSGVNKRLLAKNSLALFVNCDNHSLNLAGAHPVKHEPVMIIDSLYGSRNLAET